MNANHETTTASNDKDCLEQQVRDVLDVLVDQGQLWARYGLNAARLALETNARTMSTVATMLGRLADGLEAKKTEEVAVEVSSVDEPPSA